MSVSRLSAAAFVEASDIDTPKILKGVEDHYNHLQTLEASFSESLTVHGHKHTERGELYLRKPGRMRWQYTSPEGKLVVSDAKYIYTYLPDEKRVDRENFKESEDMRAPLAFLLGKLHFQDDFKTFHAEPDGNNVFITATPKSDKLPYSDVTFLVSPDSVIHYLKVIGQDGSITEFVFENEKMNPPLAESLFKFIPPKDAVLQAH